jgi:hypothetical protein
MKFAQPFAREPLNAIKFRLRKKVYAADANWPEGYQRNRTFLIKWAQLATQLRFGRAEDSMACWPIARTARRSR